MTDNEIKNGHALFVAQDYIQHSHNWSEEQIQRYQVVFQRPGVLIAAAVMLLADELAELRKALERLQ